MTIPEQTWYPIATSEDLVLRHVYDAKLLGQEMAAWRADDGFANVWENRCLHRGVRLTIGVNDGSELKCQYHGWRYANRTASCTYIPAHPIDAPSRTVCNRSYQTQEKYGLVWASVKENNSTPTIENLDEADLTVFRAIPIKAPLSIVQSMLCESPLFTGIDDKLAGLSERKSCERLVTFVDPAETSILLAFVLQPVDSNLTIIRGVGSGFGTAQQSRSNLLNVNIALTRFRNKVESVALLVDEPEPIKPIYSRVGNEEATLPAHNEASSNGLRVQVMSKTVVAGDIAILDLKSINGVLPTAQAGAHIDVHMPNGMIRQYSVSNGPEESDIYRIGVKLEPESKGGSRCMHEVVRQGDVLMISEPRNNFPLRRDAIKSVFVAGGIGITPLLSMAKTIRNQGLAFELHYFVRSQDHVAFKEQLAPLGDSVIIHAGLDPTGTGDTLIEIYQHKVEASHTYICGPGPMLDAARNAASICGWLEDSVHFEYFSNTQEIDTSSSFEIALSRSGKTLKVEAGKTILEVLRANGIALTSSCEQGACGTCKVTVIEGDVDHQDVCLTETDKKQNKFIMTCVSRAKSERLVLDI